MKESRQNGSGNIDLSISGSEAVVNDWKPKTAFGSWLDRYFSIAKNGSSIGRELIGGLIIFLAMFYILPVNSDLLGVAWNGGTIATIYEGCEMSAQDLRSAIFAATAISAGLTSVVMGIYGKLPIGLASGMGINALVAFTILGKMNYNFSEAMCIVFVSGIIFLLISITPLRAKIVQAIPKSLKIAISSGIGFFIAFIGLKNMGVIASSPATFVTLGNLADPMVYCGLIGLLLVVALSSLPQNKKLTFWISKFSVIIAMVVMGIICASMAQCGALGSGETAWRNGAFKFYTDGYSYASLGNINEIFGRSIVHGWSAFARPETYALIFVLLFIDFFDTTGTLLGVEQGAGMVDDDGKILVDDRPAMVTDAAGTVFGSICGTSTVTSFVESTTGVAAGARTGLAALTTGILFLLSLAIYPALGMFSCPSVTALALVYVGICMFSNLGKLEWGNWTAIGSGFITIIIMILSYSISDGIAWGFITYTIMTLASGKFKKDDIPVSIISVLFVVLYIVKLTCL